MLGVDAPSTSESLSLTHPKRHAYFLSGAQRDVLYRLLVATVGQRALDHETMTWSGRPAGLRWNVGNT